MSKIVMQLCAVACVAVSGFAKTTEHPMNGFALIAIGGVFALLSIGASK